MEIQQRLRGQVRARDDGVAFRCVAAMDVSYDRRATWIYAGLVLLRIPEFTVVEQIGIRHPAGFPYIPGLLSFRESPAGLAVWQRLRHQPDCLICDGHGYAHPRRFGFACHFGLWVDLPTIGCAKSVLVGSFAPPARERGSVSALLEGGEVIGAAVRTREGAAPVFVSVGHRISLETAIATVLACGARFRIPEPLRKAHALVNRMRERGMEILVGEG